MVPKDEPEAPPQRARSLGVIRLMTLATYSLSALAICSGIMQSLMLPSYGRYGDPALGLDDGSSPLGGVDDAPSVPVSHTASPPPSPPPAEVSEEDAQELFLEAVKRRVKYQTPLDTTFWRPYARPQTQTSSNRGNQTNFIFVAGAEGTGHHFVTAVMMRLQQLMPMTLVQEQMFQALWWKPSQQDPQLFWGALEAFFEWVQTARSNDKHPAFCARTCLRIQGMKHCSWISGMQQQQAGRLLDGKGHNGSFQPIGQMFSYPFSRSWNETEDGEHFPKISDLQYLAELAGLRLRVIVLYRDPVDAIMSMNNRGLPKIWRRFGRTFKLHKQVDLFLSQLDEMHSQLKQLHADDYRVLNYTDLLVNSQDYSRELSDFLNLPEASISRAFLLSIKAKPKKHKEEKEAPKEQDGQWSDDVRRTFIERRLKERANASKCCATWIEKLQTSRVARLPQPKPPTKERHWFSKWAEKALPPRRAQQVSFTHVINPFDPGQDEERKMSMLTTLQSVAHAQALASAQEIAVDVVCTHYPEDLAYVKAAAVGTPCRIVPLNASLHSLLPQFKHPYRLPFLYQILYAGYLHGKGRYLTYSNIDIGVQPPFYIKLAHQLQVMPEVPISVIREEFEHVDNTFNVESAIAQRNTGLGHPGHDCWTFPREWVPRLVLGFSMVGVSMIATDLMQALYAISGCRMSMLSPRVTFHYVEGDSVVKHPGNQRTRSEKIFAGLYTAWNCAQFARNRRDVLLKYPEYNQCWFSQQAEWNIYSYQCAATIEHLPFEFKMLWHDNRSALTKISNTDCNLPSVCAKCRKQGSRPAADLMATIPCGFCRCASDLGTQSSFIIDPAAPTKPIAAAKKPLPEATTEN